MIKKSVTYKDSFNEDEEVTEALYFHLTMTEVIELELEKEKEGGLAGLLRKITEAEDAAIAYHLFKDVILRAYLIKGPDGRKPVKNQQLRDEFAISEAYSRLVMDFLEKPETFAAFINAVLPRDMIQQAERLAAQQQMPIVTPDIEKVVPRFMTRAELEELPLEEYKEAVNKIATGEIVINTDIPD